MNTSGGYFSKINAKRAALWHGHPSRSLHVILVTGTYGKSTTALLLANLLEASGSRVAVFTNIESRIDTERYRAQYDLSADTVHAALALARKKAVDFVILEVTSFVEQDHILDTIHYNSVIATSVTDRVSALFSKEVEYATLPFADERMEITLAPHQIIYFGDKEGSDALIKDVKLHRGGTEMTIVLDHHHEYPLASYLCGTANTFNVAAAVAMAYVLGADVDSFTEGIARLERVRGNFETLRSGKTYRLIVDAARAEHSLELVTASAKQLTKRRLLVVLDASFGKTAIDTARKHADQVTVYNSTSTEGHVKLAKDRNDAAISTIRGARTDDTVILVGPSFVATDAEGTLEILSVIAGE